MDNTKSIKTKLNNNFSKIIEIKTDKLYPHRHKLNPQCDVEKNLQKKFQKKRRNNDCGKDVERFVEKVFNKEFEFSTVKLSISLVNG